LKAFSFISIKGKQKCIANEKTIKNNTFFVCFSFTLGGAGMPEIPSHPITGLNYHLFLSPTAGHLSLLTDELSKI
jgi:hypothetical protein